MKIEDYTNKVGYSERTDEVIEPRISVQWFMRMKELAEPALELVMNDDDQFPPCEVQEHVPSLDGECQGLVHLPPALVGTPDPGLVSAKRGVHSGENDRGSTGNCQVQIQDSKSDIPIADLKQDEDVMDTWFSSWLWPISVFDGIRNPGKSRYQLLLSDQRPGHCPEIIFFWVARMIMAGLEYRKAIPFRNVYFTGIVRDKQGRKMSKSLGNSPEPLDLIENYGADAVRVGMLLCSPAGNDLLYDEGLIEQGRNFCNKIWNAMRLVKGWEVDETLANPAQ